MFPEAFSTDWNQGKSWTQAIQLKTKTIEGTI